jgi:hypothetical protein
MILVTHDSSVARRAQRNGREPHDRDRFSAASCGMSVTIKDERLSRRGGATGRGGGGGGGGGGLGVGEG